ncbi:MAG: peptidoglycan binding protein CsiV [Pseudomonadales bacterium]|nr:peptidoglycan binding protein CsiV [Pseudomonadales bacterium]
MKQLIVKLSLFPLVCWAMSSYSQIQLDDALPSEEDPWYEVSLVIFKQPQHLLQSEQWKPGDEQDLRLPNHLIALETASEASAETNISAESTAVNEANIVETNQPEIPSVFAEKSATDEEFIETVNRLTRSRNYEILYQNSWLQPALDKNSALPVLIQAGEVFEGLYELEGTTTLHVARYLHFKTDLWLSDYVQQLEVVKPWWQDTDEESSTEVVQDIGIDSSPEPLTIQLGNEEQPSHIIDMDAANNADATMAMGETITRYKSIQTGVMNESRRMRSGELHYIDHPLFGVVVKVTPFLIKEPEEEPADTVELNQ